MQFAIDQIEEIKHDGNHITAKLSYADLIQLSGYAAVEYCGGPTMIFRIGREDGHEEEAVDEHRLSTLNETKPAILQAKGFSLQDYVALMGSRTLGFAHLDRTGF